MPPSPAPPLRVVFVGHAALLGRAVVLGGHELVACVVAGSTPLRDLARDVRADLRPSRRSPTERLAHDHSVPLVRVREQRDWSGIAGLGADVLLCAGFPRRIPSRAFDALPLGGLNVHPSLLPAHRGPRPVERTILAGDATTGVTIHRLSAEFDAGDIVWAAACLVLPTEPCAALTNRLLTVAASALPAVLATIRAEPRAGRAQLASALERRPSPLELRPDLALPAEVVRRRVLAGDGADFVDERGARVRAVGVLDVERGSARTRTPGVVLRQSGQRVLVATGDAGLWLALEREPRRRLQLLRAVVA